MDASFQPCWLKHVVKGLSVWLQHVRNMYVSQMGTRRRLAARSRPHSVSASEPSDFSKACSEVICSRP